MKPVEFEPEVKWILVGLVILSLSALACAGSNESQTEVPWVPKTPEGNQCRNQCNIQHNTCVGDWVDKEGKEKRYCRNQRDSCYDNCEAFEQAALAEQEERRNPPEEKRQEPAPREPAQAKLDTSKPLQTCAGETVCFSKDECLSGHVCDTRNNRCLELACVKQHMEAKSKPVAGDVVANSTALALVLERRTPTNKASAESTGESSSSSDAKPASTSLAERKTFTADEAAQVCGVERAVIVQWINDGKLQAVQLGGSYRISRRELADTWREMGGGELFD